MDRLRVLLYEGSCRRKVNAGFQNAQRPVWYGATQELIVPKRPVFEAICARIQDRYLGHCHELVIFEPGAGLASFFEFVLTQTSLPEQFVLHLIGADLSHDMARAGHHLLSQIQPRPNWRPVRVELYSRVNLLELNSADVRLCLCHRPFDVVVALQFEHYYPNHSESDLALRLRAQGLKAPTKHDFRQFACEQLRTNGLYFAFDDYSSGTQPRDAEQVLAWDRFVARRLSDPDCLNELGWRFPVIAAALRRKYPTEQGLDTLVRKVATARLRRRSLCHEESADLQSALVDLEAVFGPDILVQPHPWAESHGLFFLLCATAAVRQGLHSRLDSPSGTWQAIPEHHATVASP